MPRVKNEMVGDPVTVRVPGTRTHLLQLFLRHGQAGFPVVKGDSRKLVGVVTRHELFDDPEESQIVLLMNPNPATTYPEAPLDEAARVIAENRLRVLPVVSGSNDLVGVLTPGDLLPPLPKPSGRLASHLARRFAPMHVSTPLVVAMETLRATRSTALPVLDDQARFCGLLTDGELLRHLRLRDRVSRSVVGLAGDGDAWKWAGLRDERSVQHHRIRLEPPDGPVADLMAREVPRVSPNTAFPDAVRILLAGGLGHVPVVDAEGRLVDLLSDVDLLGAMVA